MGANDRAKRKAGWNWGVHEEQYQQRCFDSLQKRTKSETWRKHSDEQGFGADKSSGRNVGWDQRKAGSFHVRIWAMIKKVSLSKHICDWWYFL